MSHFFYLVAFGFFVSAAFAVFADGSVRDRVIMALDVWPVYRHQPDLRVDPLFHSLVNCCNSNAADRNRKRRPKKLQSGRR